MTQHRSPHGRCALWILIGLALGVVSCQPAPSLSEEGPTDVVAVLGAEPSPGFEPIMAVAEIEFPPDHGPHPAQQIEWWYTTINLRGERGQRFGVEVTFFRIGLVPPAERIERQSAWATDDLYMAHFAVTDAEANRFTAFERFTRGGLQLAGATGDPWRVWNETWELRGTGGGERPFPLSLRADDRDRFGDVAIDLVLDSEFGAVRHGDHGFSRKGTEPGNASRYYSYPSLNVSGTLQLGGRTHSVSGTGWFDHEWSTSVLGDSLEGWDWFSVQLDDGGRLMLFELRQETGEVSFGSGTWIAPDGVATPLDREDFTIEVLDEWQSQKSGVIYPNRWRLNLQKRKEVYELVPILANQELRLSTRYWEGAVDVNDSKGKQIGWGYVELVGYGPRSTDQ